MWSTQATAGQPPDEVAESMACHYSIGLKCLDG
jgi:hypothetical protein